MLDQQRQSETPPAGVAPSAGQADPRSVAAPAASARAAPASPPGSRHSAASLDALPLYARSLLRIKVPVIVTLAQKRQSLRKVLELGPGAIIHFEKPCDETLQLAVGHRPVAQGQAVKVGEKFGLAITAIQLPEERFTPVLSPTAPTG